MNTTDSVARTGEESPGLRATVAYLRPFGRAELLASLAGLGVFVQEQQADAAFSRPASDVDLRILVARGEEDVALVRYLSEQPPILVVIVPSRAAAAECLAAGAGLCLVDDDVFGAPRHALASAARLARQRRAVAHGAAPTSPPTLELGEVIFSSAACSLRSPTGRVPLSRTERDILTRLAADRGVPVRSEVLADAARIRMFPSSRYLGSVIVSLRKKLRRLGVDAGTLATVHGVGYVLLTPEQLRQDAR